MLLAGIQANLSRFRHTNVSSQGHETTANTLAWLFHILSYYPDCVTKIQAELDSVLGSNQFPTFDDIPKLKYVKSCINEGLRLYPQHL